MATIFQRSPNTIPHPPNFQPARVLEIELSQPLPAVSPLNAQTGLNYRQALALIRLHTRPVGKVELALNDHGLDPLECGGQIWQSLGDAINAHLRGDGLPAVKRLEANGLHTNGTPPCLAERRVLLSQAPFASVIVATRDRTTSLAASLQSLLSLEYPAFEILVVDNAPSTNEAARFIHRTYGDQERVRYLREDRPGLAIAHNRALQEAKGAIVAFTDDDVIADRHWLAELAKGFTIAENVGCVTGMIFPAKLDTAAQTWFEEFGGLSKGFDCQIFDLAENRPRDLLYPYSAGKFGSGANMAFRTGVLRQLGGFDPATGTGTPTLGGDDLAAFFQVITAGYRLVYEPAAIIHHEHRHDYATLRRQIYGYGTGLSAFLTKALVDRPGRALDLALKLPAGLGYLLSPSSPKNASKQAGYPKELTWLERKGIIYGPFAYLRSRRQVRR